MASTIQSQSKRIRTNDTQRPRDPTEELSQVAGLVERRRMQNRISQRNYRKVSVYHYIPSDLDYISGNKIRERLEALEALVDKTGKEQDSSPSSPRAKARDEPTIVRAPHSAEATEQPSPPSQTCPTEITTEQPYSWDDMNDIFDTSPPAFDTLGDYNDTNFHQESLSQYTFDKASPIPFTGGPSIDLPSPAMTSPRSNLFDKQLETIKPEQSILETATKLDRNGQKFPSQPNNSPSQPDPPNSNIPYGYSFPFGAPYLPFNGMAISNNNTNGHPLSQLPPVAQGYGHDTQSVPSTNYFPSQQYVWVPVPVMTFPVPPPTQERDVGTPGEAKSQ
ncbi:hypothetical protein ACLMJK_002551 [Lecanora helva]